MSGYFIYIGIEWLLLSCAFLTDYSLFFYSLSALWIIRIYRINLKPLFILSLLVILLVGLRMRFSSSSQTNLSDGEILDSRVIYIKQTTIKIDGDLITFLGKVRKEESLEEVVIRYKVPEESVKLMWYDAFPSRIVMTGSARKANEPSNFRQFNYKQYLERKKIDKMIDVNEVTVLSYSTSWDSPYFIDSIRQKILSYIDKVTSPIIAGYSKALLFGDRRDFSEEVSDSFRELGIIHLLSISGMHIHIILVIINFILIKLTVTTETNRWIQIVILPLYGLAAGFSVSIFRAVGQTWFKKASEQAGVKLTSFDCWSMVLITALLVDPYVLYSVGFQLSYGISFIIILLTNQSFFQKISSPRSAVILSFSIFLGSVPILTYHFYEFSWGVLLLNSIYIPLLSVVILPSIISLLLLSLFAGSSSFYTLISQWIEKVFILIETSTFWLSERGSFSIVTGRLSLYAVIVFFACYIFYLLIIEEKSIKYKLFLFPITGIILSLFSTRFSPYGQVMMIDVGQGEAIMIKEPWGKGNFLIDTGGIFQWQSKEIWQMREKPFSVGSDVVVPVLKAQGVHKLETIVITHADWDHYGALEDVIQAIPTNIITSNTSTLENSDFQDSFPLYIENGTMIKDITLLEKNELPDGMRDIETTRSWEKESNKNDQSVLLAGKIGQFSWLFTGDLEEEGEDELVKLYPNLEVDILKVGHHGSNTSTHAKLLDHLNPDYAWISSGKNNPYGHPHPNVIGRLEERNIKYFRTDEQGAIRYIYAGNKWLDHYVSKDNPFEVINEK